MSLVLAHVGHWYTAAAFFVPVLVLPLGLWAATILGNRGEEHPGAD